MADSSSNQISKASQVPRLNCYCQSKAYKLWRWWWWQWLDLQGLVGVLWVSMCWVEE